ncbi:hypothetical protein CEXT_720101 [Caerostris extrusa]|uniref:Uncharacterized protein n=1 Tax=Caerostris extrusa TaxID=172846 RepID=A0AAV4SWG7_CAEEX|nr:hypothetical protein CEXT_720101 [Caerostris extrusa]
MKASRAIEIPFNENIRLKANHLRSRELIAVETTEECYARLGNVLIRTVTLTATKTPEEVDMRLENLRSCWTQIR